MARVISIALLATDRMSEAFSDAADSSEKLTKHLGGLNKVAKAGGLAMAAGGAASLAGAMAPAVAAVAAMPAQMVAVKVASATLKVGLQGVGNAMSAVAEGDAKALKEALKDLSPAAAAFVKETAKLKKEWTGIQQAVQQNLFQGLDKQLSVLGKSLLPVVGDGMKQVAGELNGVALEAAKTAKTPWFRGELDKVFTGTAGVVGTLSGAVRPLTQAVLTLVNAGMPLLNRMAGWAVEGAKAAASFLMAKQRSGALSAAITMVGDGFETAGRIARNFGVAIANVIGQANAFGVSGGSMVTTLEKASAAMLAWSQSSQGQGQASAGFAMLGEAANNLSVVLPILAGSIGIIAKGIMALPAPVQGAAVQMTSWGIVASILITRLAAIPGVTRAVVLAMGGLKATMVAGKTAAIGFALGLKSVDAAYASNATWATRLGAALRAQVILWRQQAAAAGVSTARIIVHAAVQKVVAVATRVWAAAQWVLNAALSANPIGIVIAVIVALVAAVVIAYKKSDTFRAIVQAAWAGIKSAIGAVWGFIKPIFDAIRNVVGKVLPMVMTVFKNVVKVAWIAIQIYIKVAWTLIKSYFMAIKMVITNVLAPVFRFLYNNVVKPVFNQLRSHISAVWNNGIKPTFENLKKGLESVKRGFQLVVAGIKVVWDKLKNIAKVPVNFVIGTIYNKGIVGLVNKVAAFAGIKTRLDKIPLLERGGTLNNPAAARPMVTNGPMAIVGEGRRAHPEYVIPTDPAHRKRAQALWAQAGQSLAGKTGMGGEGLAFARGGQLPMLAGGGIIGGFMNKLKGFNFLDPVKAFKGALNRLVGTVPGSGAFRDAIAGIPTRILEQLVAWFKAKVGMGGGGPGMGRGLAWAKTQNGKPYQWGGNGNPSWDCSGFVSAIESVIRGQNPHRRWSTHPFHGGAHNPMPGWYRGMKSPYQIGVTGAGVGHVAGTLLGKNVESSGSGGVRVGGGARGASDSMFPFQYGFKADSGALMLKPGWNPPTFNGTGRPELLQTARPGGGNTYEINVHVAPGGNLAETGRQVVQAIKEYERRSGRGWRS